MRSDIPMTQTIQGYFTLVRSMSFPNFQQPLCRIETHFSRKHKNQISKITLLTELSDLMGKHLEIYVKSRCNLRI